MKRALVLGGGGAVGIAWEIGVCAGLLDEGVDARDADLIVGTSAGSVVGTSLAHGADPRELYDQQRRPREPLAPPHPRDPAEVAAVFRLWASFDDMTEAACREVGAAAVSASTGPEDRWLAAFSAHGWPGWPSKPLLITAVECATGSFRAFDAGSGVPIERAVAASCSVPGLMPPVTIDGRRYMDGGVRSGTSADLVQRIEPDTALILAPMGRRDGGVDRQAAHQLAREMGELEAAGVSVRLVQFDDATKEIAGANLMDPARAAPAAEAGRAQGRRIAADVRLRWLRTADDRARGG